MMNSVRAALLALLVLGTSTVYADGDPRAGHWHDNVNEVSRSVDVATTQSGWKIDLNVTGAASGFPNNAASNVSASSLSISSGTSSGGTSQVRSSPGGGGGSSVRVVGSRDWTWQAPTGGVNEIVRGGPVSSETGTRGGGNYAFGGAAVGGWTFPTIDAPQLNGVGGIPATVAVTTGWASIGPVPQIDPWSVARAGESEAPLPRITLKVNPDPGRVALASWFWVEGYTGGVIAWSKTEHASHTECRLEEGVPQCRSVDDSVTVNLQATPRLYEWTFGDNVNNDASFDDAQGLGRAYTDPNTASPVAHAYHMSSLKYLKDGGYPIELRVAWAAAFSVNGGGAQGLPDVSQTYAARYQVRQIQSIVEH